MIANYHTHTTRCRHAQDAEEEYVQNAIEGGLQILGFSDHSPYWFPGEHYSTFRMFPDQLEDYCQTVIGLREKYAGKLQIRLGLEVEYYPAYFDELMAHLRDTPIEYMLLGQHFIGNEIAEPYSYSATQEESVLERYCHQVMDAMQTGLFTYIAHPDLINYQGDENIYRKHIGRLCREAKACGIPLEINLLGIRGQRMYPNERFWEVAAQEGCTAILGCDAHCAADVCDRSSEKTALALAEKYGIALLDTVALRPIK